jgi:hypothetical protein
LTNLSLTNPSSGDGDDEDFEGVGDDEFYDTLEGNEGNEGNEGDAKGGKGEKDAKPNAAGKLRSICERFVSSLQSLRNYCGIDAELLRNRRCGIYMELLCNRCAISLRNHFAIVVESPCNRNGIAMQSLRHSYEIAAKSLPKCCGTAALSLRNC